MSDRFGIDDIDRFYFERFFTGSVLDARYFDPIDRFHMKFARTMWVYDNVRSGTTLLDLGCGEGVLALLKLKDVCLFGVDIAREFAELARFNGYDFTCVADVCALPFPDGFFDYVVSLDLLGHVPSSQKESVLAEIKRVLRPAGTTLHGIECLNAELHGSYDEMSEARLQEFISIDGHVGLEEEAIAVARFRKHFAHVQSESRYTLCLPSEEFIKQADRYGVPFEADFIHYLRTLSFSERRAFDMAMGYVFGKISDLRIRLPESKLYVLLKASNVPLGSFYNEHRDRAAFTRRKIAANAASVSLDRNFHAEFVEGWYAANNLPPIARWMSDRGRIKFNAPPMRAIRMDITTHMPDLWSHPLELRFYLNDETVACLSLYRYGWLELEIPLASRFRQSDEQNREFELRIEASRTWQPSRDSNSKDDRALSIAICNIELLF